MNRPLMHLPLAPPDIHAIRALHDKWIDAELRGDIAAVLELCTDDVRQPATAFIDFQRLT